MGYKGGWLVSSGDPTDNILCCCYCCCLCHCCLLETIFSCTNVSLPSMHVTLLAVGLGSNLHSPLQRALCWLSLCGTRSVLHCTNASKTSKAVMLMTCVDLRNSAGNKGSCGTRSSWWMCRTREVLPSLRYIWPRRRQICRFLQHITYFNFVQCRENWMCCSLHKMYSYLMEYY